MAIGDMRMEKYSTRRRGRGIITVWGVDRDRRNFGIGETEEVSKGNKAAAAVGGVVDEEYKTD